METFIASYKDFLPLFGTIIGSFIGAWLAARFGIKRFYKEKMWERKAEAYTAIFEALHFIGEWYQKHHDAYLQQRELTEETTAELRLKANEAEAELERQLARQTWVIPKNSRDRLGKLTAALKERPQDWFDYLDSSLGELDKATIDLRDMVHADLHISWKITIYVRRRWKQLRTPNPPWRSFAK